MLDWQVATLKETKQISPKIKSLTFQVTNLPSHQPGQHVTIRIKTPDGYYAERDYSLANPPEQKEIIELGVQILDDGEVSPYLFNMKPGQQIEVRGPIGGQFIWNISMPGPLILIAGGAGMVPLISMLRHHIINLDKDKNRQIIILASFKNFENILYYEELTSMATQDPKLKIIYTLTQNTPQHWPGPNKRIDKQLLEESLIPLKNQNPQTYICGPTIFVESTSDLISQLGFNPDSIKTERFG